MGVLGVRYQAVEEASSLCWLVVRSVRIFLFLIIG